MWSPTHHACLLHSWGCSDHRGLTLAGSAHPSETLGPCQSPDSLTQPQGPVGVQLRGPQWRESDHGSLVAYLERTFPLLPVGWGDGASLSSRD